jgi:hypothetical protein
MDYRKQFADALNAQQTAEDPIQKQLEAQIMQKSQGASMAPTVALVDNLFGGNLSASLPKEESMKDKLGQLLQMKQAQQAQKLGGLGKLAQMQGAAEQSASERAFKEKMYGLQLMKAGGASKNRLNPTDITKYNEGNQIPTMLKDIEGTVNGNTDLFGPISGRVSSLNPWDTRTQTVEAQIRSSAQSFGRFMEGGMLRPDDEIKYRKMFPNLSDTPDVAKNKLALVSRLLAQKQSSTVEALRSGGYDVSPIDQNLSIPNLPGIVSGGNDNNREPSTQTQAPSNYNHQGMDYASMDPAEVEARYNARFRKGF